MTTVEMSRRVYTRLLSSLFDVQGRHLGIIISQAKLLLKEMISVMPKSQMDVPLGDYSKELDLYIKNFWASLKNIQDDLCFHPRSTIPQGYSLSYLVVPHDAAAQMLGTVVYVVSENKTTGDIHCQNIGAKSALRSGTIPKNEKLSVFQASATVSGDRL